MIREEEALAMDIAMQQDSDNSILRVKGKEELRIITKFLYF